MELENIVQVLLSVVTDNLVKTVRRSSQQWLPHPFIIQSNQLLLPAINVMEMAQPSRKRSETGVSDVPAR